MKKHVSISIEKELADKAKELGLNISKIAENALREYLEKLGAIESKEK